MAGCTIPFRGLRDVKVFVRGRGMVDFSIVKVVPFRLEPVFDQPDIGSTLSPPTWSEEEALVLPLDCGRLPEHSVALPVSSRYSRTKTGRKVRPVLVS